MRLYIRHPVEIPIECEAVEAGEVRQEQLANISLGGLAFHSRRPFQPQSIVTVRIPLIDENFQATGQVAWCIPRGEGFEVGMKLLEQNEAFQARMIEQLCYIERYRQDILREQGRRLDPEQAAREWISRYAADFPGARERETST